MERKQIVLALLHQCTDEDAEDYKRWLRLPPEFARDPNYNASNALKWISADKYNDYLLQRGRDTSPNTNDIGEISHPEPTVDSRDKKSLPLPEIINLCSDSDDSDIEASAPIKQEVKLEDSPMAQPAGQRAKANTDKIRVTRKEKVDKVIYLSGVPERWPAADPDLDVAFVVNLSNDLRVKKLLKGDKLGGLDAQLKRDISDTFRRKTALTASTQNQESWGKGSNGSTIRETLLKILHNIPARRSIHICNGGLKCEFFDPVFLSNYERTLDSGSAVGKTAFFYRVILNHRVRGCRAKVAVAFANA
ncbi:hypothetical protein DFH08DRAFT_953663 [Mycena albidolilacea]|uniref:Uncharacterized protein n=1 Tax=Mycena albidolilacea TaxID=1033008 RepID=A0AAD7AIH5_9AGAR|nr:hypothetical protein DFH08DRAFT_953663 [Mycena albidolilacea]